MSSSREESPDWLRSFQAPTRAVVALSSGSESPLDDDQLSDDEDEIKLSRLFKKDTPIINDQEGKESPVRKSSKTNSPNKNKNVEHTPGRKRKRNDPSEKAEIKDDERVTKRKASLKPKPQEPSSSVWTLSSDSDTCPDTSPVRQDTVQHKEDEAQNVEEEESKVAVDKGGVSPRDKTSVKKSPKKQLKEEYNKSSTMMKEKDVVNAENDGDIDVGEEIKTEKQEAPQVSSSRLPLVLSEKVQRSKALVECEGDSIDLSGDVGAVGRMVISNSPSGNHDMLLDLKGTIYKTTIVPSRTFCVVSFGPSEAKIEAIMNDFIQLKPQSNVYEAETMVEGTLDGFSFDSDEEAEPKAKGGQNDKNEAAEEQPKGKPKGKAEKTRGTAGKKAKTAGGKQAKKVTKKTQVSKKSKTKK